MDKVIVEWQLKYVAFKKTGPKVVRIGEFWASDTIPVGQLQELVAKDISCNQNEVILWHPPRAA